MQAVSGRVYIQVFLRCLPPTRGHTEHTLPPAAKMQHVCRVSTQGSSLETQHPTFISGSGHLGTLCLLHTKIPDSQKEHKYFS